MPPDNLCACGCGQPTRIAERSYTKEGIVKGQPYRYLPGHNFTRRIDREEPNPSGLCKCGCGEPTPLAPYHRPNRGWVAGRPVNYLPGHHRRKSPVEYIVDPKTECWLWQRSISNGYGTVRRKNRIFKAHRVIYERERGPLPPKVELDHTCPNKHCVNPDHMQPLTKSEHTRAGHRRGQIHLKSAA